MRRLVVVFGSVVVVVVLLVVAPAAPASAGGGGCHEGRNELASTTVDISAFCFTQTVVHISPGETVTWTNHDTTEHTVSGVAFEWGSYDPLAMGRSVSNRFDQVGVFPYFCAFHPAMVGVVVVDGTTSVVATVPAGAVRPTPSGAGGNAAIAWATGIGLAGIGLLLGGVYAVARRQMDAPGAGAPF